MTRNRKVRALEPSTDWARWTTARFQTEAARDGFVSSVGSKHDDGWAVEPMPDDVLGALVRWRPGRFLSLNDMAYLHGGRILTAG